MPFSSFRDRLGSSSKHERDLVVQPVRSATQRSDGAESVLTTTTSSSTSSGNTAAIDLLKNQPLTADPVQFVQDAIAPLFNYNPKHDQVTLDDVMEYHVPRYFSPGYRHIFNLIEADIEAWGRRAKAIRQNCTRMRVRFLKTLINTAERQSMQRALVSLQYEVVVTAPHRDEDVRIPGNGIYRIEHGKITQAMVVVDLHEANVKAPEIPACVVA